MPNRDVIKAKKPKCDHCLASRQAHMPERACTHCLMEQQLKNEGKKKKKLKMTSYFFLVTKAVAPYIKITNIPH